MIHFVPAWYDPVRPWYAVDPAWFQSGIRTESDPTVTQAGIFHQGAEDAGLVVLNYAPSLRRFLHRQNIFDVPYWSFFDEVQGLDHDYTRPLDFLELEWPDDVSFFYNPFIVSVMRGTDLYARVFLAQEGTLRSVRYYGQGMPTIARIFDDRGFLSGVLMLDEGGQPITQYYLSRTGDVIVSEDVPSGRIDVVQNPDDRFRSSSYDSWETLIAEFLGKYLDRRRGARDTVVLSLSEQHNDLVASALSDQILVLSFSQARPTTVSSELLKRADAVFTDVGQLTDGSAGQAEEWAQLPVLSIYPLERRPTFGTSVNQSEVYIFLFVDNITTEDLDFAIASMAAQLAYNEHTRLLVCTYRSHDLDYLQGIKRVIAGYQNLDLDFLAADEIARLSVDVGAAGESEAKIQLTFVDRDAELLRTMAKSRVLVDLGATVNRHLAAEAVNAGVPQINRHEQELCTHLINGYVMRDDSDLATALDYFLSGLVHWNQSLVQCRIMVDLFIAQEILGRWDLIKEGVAYAGAADRP